MYTFSGKNATIVPGKMGWHLTFSAEQSRDQGCFPFGMAMADVHHEIMQTHGAKFPAMGQEGKGLVRVDSHRVLFLPEKIAFAMGAEQGMPPFEMRRLQTGGKEGRAAIEQQTHGAGAARLAWLPDRGCGM